MRQPKKQATTAPGAAPAAGTATDTAGAANDTDHRNEVRLVGRVSGSPEQRELPSGDSIVVVRLVVARAGPPRTPRSPRVDTIECSAQTGKARRSVGSWANGDLVEVRGEIRRWFRRGPQGPISRYGIEVNGGRRVRPGRITR